MRVLVTGGGGFIGSHLVERLLDDGHSVRVLDNFSTGHRSNLEAFGDHVELIEGDVQSFERVQMAVRGCDVVLHQAALPSVPRSIQDPLTSNAVNVMGTLNVLLAARDNGVRRVVYASSSSIYGANPILPKVETLRAQPISPYAVGKLAGEAYCQTFWEVYGLETVALRYFNVFGPRQDPSSQYSAVIPRFVNTCLDGGRPTIFGDGEQSRDFTYVGEVVRGNMLSMTAPNVAGSVLNLACGHRVTLNGLLQAIRDVLGIEVEPVYAPARPGDLRHSTAAVEAARTALGFVNETSFETGLRDTIEYYQSHRKTLRERAAWRRPVPDEG